MDFSFVRRGHYDIRAIFDPNGIYDSFHAAGLISFGIGFVVELFFTNLGFYGGPVFQALGGGDIARDFGRDRVPNLTRS